MTEIAVEGMGVGMSFSVENFGLGQILIRFGGRDILGLRNITSTGFSRYGTGPTGFESWVL